MFFKDIVSNEVKIESNIPNGILGIINLNEESKNE